MSVLFDINNELVTANIVGLRHEYCNFILSQELLEEKIFIFVGGQAIMHQMPLTKTGQALQTSIRITLTDI
jgi:hypothetical protein